MIHDHNESAEERNAIAMRHRGTSRKRDAVLRAWCAVQRLGGAKQPSEANVRRNYLALASRNVLERTPMIVPPAVKPIHMVNLSAASNRNGSLWRSGLCKSSGRTFRNSRKNMRWDVAAGRPTGIRMTRNIPGGLILFDLGPHSPCIANEL